MSGPGIPERDWKYLRSIQQDLLNTYCQAANQQVISLLHAEGKSPHECWLDAIECMKQSRRDAEDLFDDWRRSTIGLKVLYLRRKGLLTSEQINRLSSETREWLAQM